MNRVAVVILNWNGRNYLKEFLPLVISRTDNADIIVADNGSSDDSVDFLKKNFSSIEILQLEKNYGFTGGYNRVLSQLDHEIFVLMNSDVEPGPGWLSPLVDLMDRHPEIAACQPKVKDFNKKDFFEYAGAGGGFLDKWGYPFCRGRIFDHVETDQQLYGDREIFWASGACLCIRKECWKKARGFDDDMFAHMEEIDLCWRLQNFGYKIAACGNSEVFHIGGGTLSKINPRKTYLNFRNNLSILLKNLHKSELPNILILRLILDGVAGLKFLLSGQPNHMTAVIKAHLHFYRNFRETLKKRGLHQKKLNELGGIYRKSIIVEYFLKRKKNFKDLEIPDTTSFPSKVLMDVHNKSQR